jgi:hypothetical protein
MSETKAIKKKVLLDELGDLMNRHVEAVPEGDERDEVINACLEVLLIFGFISAYVAGIDEDTMHDMVHDVFTDLVKANEKNAN